VSSWERRRAVLAQAAQILPADARVVVVADRAFARPAFPALAVAHGGAGLAPVHGQPRWRDRRGGIPLIRTQVCQRGEGWNGAGLVVNEAGWRAARLGALWGRAHQQPLLRGSRLPRSWELIALDRQRAAIAALFRDWKSSARQREARQVRDLAHQERLVSGLALATRITPALGAHAAAQVVPRGTRGGRRRRWAGGRRRFRLGGDACWQRR